MCGCKNVAEGMKNQYCGSTCLYSSHGMCRSSLQIAGCIRRTPSVCLRQPPPPMVEAWKAARFMEAARLVLHARASGCFMRLWRASFSRPPPDGGSMNRGGRNRAGQSGNGNGNGKEAEQGEDHSLFCFFPEKRI